MAIMPSAALAAFGVLGHLPANQGHSPHAEIRPAQFQPGRRTQPCRRARKRGPHPLGRQPLLAEILDDGRLLVDQQPATRRHWEADARLRWLDFEPLWRMHRRLRRQRLREDAW